MTTTSYLHTKSRRWALLHRAWRIRRPDGDVYLTRWRLVQTPWFGVYVHRFDAPDPDPHRHDHPWPFVTVVLRGGYTEDFERNANVIEIVHRPGRVFRRRTTDRHSVAFLHAKPTWTLVLVGRRCRTWGFWVPVAGTSEYSFVPWQTYLGIADAD